jgi:hypothetical protein
MYRTLLLLYSFLFYSASNANAQYIIPGASQQPAWTFPIWLDTIYVGYDPTGSLFGVGDHDTIFGEYPVYLNMAVFNSYMCGSNNDSAYKVWVCNFSDPFQCGNAGGDIYATQGWLPLKVGWDISLFRSDSLPFPDQDPAPRAQAIISFDGIAVDSTGTCSGDLTILVTDTFTESYTGCYHAKDSVQFTQLSWLQFKIEPWTGMHLGLDEINIDPISLYPNPTTSTITLNSPSTYINTPFTIYNSLGEKIFTSYIKSTHQTIELPAAAGVYFLKVEGQGNFVQKLIIY